jgi:hypothetical protein
MHQTVKITPIQPKAVEKINRISVAMPNTAMNGQPSRAIGVAKTLKNMVFSAFVITFLPI